MAEERNNKFFKNIEKIIYKMIIKIDFINIIINISSIIKLFYIQKESIIIPFINIFSKIITYIRLFNMLIQQFIQFYIVNIGIKLLDIIVYEIGVQNSQVISVIINLLRELRC